ncbi:MAG: exodeoxyribonuclease VII large subunit [Clostridiales bacterium]|jgi:exodeoxyribonuclease VII large subunit|nr:exodeoxyribonuclease VII large subunit [Clostridiales bacterium]
MRIYTVGEITRYVKAVLDEDAILSHIFIEGEISNYLRHSSGHSYFTLKDASAAMSAVMFKGYGQTLAFKPDNGMRVVAFGRVSLYEKTGQYQLYVQKLEPSGIGALYAAYQQLKDKLLAEGLFAQEWKKPIPKSPRTVALVTASTGAAVHDMIRTIQRRDSTIKIVVVPAKVQGDGAARDIARALAEADEWGGAEVIILGRGGGSLEDLWAFNEERTARAVFGVKTPIISAIGHETDFTMADFAADLRASTPTAAAELVSPVRRQVYARARTYARMLDAGMKRILEKRRLTLSGIQSRAALRRPLEILRNRRARALALTDRLTREARRGIGGRKQRLQSDMLILENISPLTVLRRGYGLVYDSGVLLARAADARQGQDVTVLMHDGTIAATITEVRL